MMASVENDPNQTLTSMVAGVGFNPNCNPGAAP
jgi:hypothetical protein